MHFSPFVHLHNHSDFSLLASPMKLKGMLKAVAAMRQPAVALTDYSNLFGAIEFYSQAMGMGIKPILGCEMYLCDDHAKRVSDGSRRPRYPQIVLLARNNQGWQNLLKLVSISYLEGFYYKPRIDKQLLRRYARGLIALSSGWDGEIEQLFRQGQDDQARELAMEYRDIFEENCFFIELQRQGLNGQEALNQQMIRLAHELNLPLVASNNCNFLVREDFQAYEAMVALDENKTVHDDLRHHSTPESYLKSCEEMQELFADVPEALENTLQIANRCNVNLQFGNYQLPDFRPPNGMDLKEYIRLQAREGLDARWPMITAGRPDASREEYDARLKFELDVIESMGFPGYFLIVSDFIVWAKQHDIPVGPGRGSGAGSLVAYVLGITDLDPIRYGLLFERFLNPERVSMPDFDVDFCMDRRDEVIRYVTDKYGEDHVAQIITYGSMKAKAVVRDAGRVLDMDLTKVNMIAKLIPNDLKMTLDKALVEEERLALLVKEDDEVARLFELGRRMEGCHRNAGKHAAGVIIGRDPLVETAPLFKVPREDGKVVQWDMINSEKVGLIKFDFLGLKTLTVIHLACQLLRRQPGHENFDISLIPLDDRPTFRLLQRGQTAAVFQVESSGMRDLLTRLKPDCFEDIIALVALYRPGPLESGMVDTYIECKHGRQEIVYLLPQLKGILQETNGVILYQEQVMQIAQVLAGYTLGQADMLRRAMGKKKAEEMAEQRKIFMDGASSQKVPEDRAEQIFDLMEKFAGYGFNKSHSAAYALIAYQTAYLKAHFPQAFMAATLSCDMGSSDKVAALVQDCNSMGLKMLPPDINASDWEFTPEGDAIRFGLGAVKGVGEAAIREIVTVRQQGGVFASFEDLVMRLPPRTLNKRICEALIKAGAMQALVPHPNAALTYLSDALDEANRRKQVSDGRQSLLFEAAEPGSDGYGLFGEAPAWSMGESLQAEREVLGFYLTGHPLEEYLENMHGLGDVNLKQLEGLDHDARIVIPVGVSSVREHRGGRGTMAFIQLEDLHGRQEAVCFAKVYEKSRELWTADKPLLASVRVDRKKEELSLIIEHVILLEEALPELVARLCIGTSSIAWDQPTVDELKTFIGDGQQGARLQFHLQLADGSIAELESVLRLPWDDTVRQWLHERFGRAAVRLYCRPWQPAPDVKERRQA